VPVSIYVYSWDLVIYLPAARALFIPVRAEHSCSCSNNNNNSGKKMDSLTCGCDFVNDVMKRFSLPGTSRPCLRGTVERATHDCWGGGGINQLVTLVWLHT
jgi:hypothetical protein